LTAGHFFSLIFEKNPVKLIADRGKHLVFQSFIFVNLKLFLK